MKKTEKRKMGRMKKWLAGVLTLVVVMAGVPMYGGMELEAAQSGDFWYEVNDDGNSVTIIGYNRNSGDVVIPAEIEGKKVTSIGKYVFSDRSGLTSVTIPNGVTNIGEGAFISAVI